MALNHFQKQIDTSTNRKQATFIYYVLHVAFRVFRATLEAFSYKYIVLLTAYCMDWTCKTWTGFVRHGFLKHEMDY